ncbi:hypothetical protein [Rhodococcus rhodochrous]|uniref:hypothetical protein n=1 Tax=Rhodococcus rhodochrous TaxID=1829 RepID=UPI003F53EFDB
MSDIGEVLKILVVTAVEGGTAVVVAVIQLDLRLNRGIAIVTVGIALVRPSGACCRIGVTGCGHRPARTSPPSGHHCGPVPSRTRRVAIADFDHIAPELLPLRVGDQLIVNTARAAVRARHLPHRPRPLSRCRCAGAVETGPVLGQHSGDSVDGAAFTDLTVGEPLDPSLFTWDGPVVSDE